MRRAQLVSVAKRTWVWIILSVGWVAVLSLSTGYVGAVEPQRHSSRLVRVPSSLPSVAPQQAAQVLNRSQVFNQYCVSCHSQKSNIGKDTGVMFDALDLANIAQHSEIWEKVVRKVRSGTMPPPGLPRPDVDTYRRIESWLTTELDRAASADPNPGRTEAFHRLNRVEYRNAVRDLLDLDGLEFDGMLPPDDESYGFDNIAGILGISSTLLDRYLSASRRISRIAVGDLGMGPESDIVRIPLDLSQDHELEGLPLGTRGGTLVRRYFPVDGEYVIKFEVLQGFAASAREPNKLEVSIDGERARTFPISDPMPPEVLEEFLVLDEKQMRHEMRLPLKAGVHEIAVTFVQMTSAEVDGILRPYLRTPTVSGFQHARAGGYGGPYLSWVSITGPFNVTGVGETPSRRRIFSCRPSTAADELPCATKILSTLARRAYRRPVTNADVEPLLALYSEARPAGGFDKGIQTALERLLVSPQFLFRIEPDSAEVRSGASYRVSDLALASRLSFFLWSSSPDDELLDVAANGKLKDPQVLKEQVRRMLADPRSQELVNNFAGQWLKLRNVDSTRPDPRTFLDFDETLRRSFRRETELLFGSVLNEGRSVLELLTADYTFVNERLARHYGIPGVYGSKFRRVTLTDSRRRGLLGHGSILAVNSETTRTSPVKRGKWILENLVGSPPPPPPANVPGLKAETKEGKPLTMREAMVQHRANPVCASCHRVMDPLGFALENFDAVGQWRDYDENGTPIDASGALPNGTAFEGVDGLRKALVSQPEAFAATVTEKLLIYALGRGLEYYDMPAVRTITREAADDGYRLDSVILGIVKSVPFQMRKSQS